MNIPPEYTLDSNGDLRLSEAYEKLLSGIKERWLAEQIMRYQYRDKIKFEFSLEKTGPWEPRINLQGAYEKYEAPVYDIPIYKRTSLDNGKTWHGPFEASSFSILKKEQEQEKKKEEEFIIKEYSYSKDGPWYPDWHTWLLLARVTCFWNPR